MRVLLVHPKPPSTFWSFEGALLPPLGLITVAALLPQHWDMRLVDEQVRAPTSADWSWPNL